MKLTKEEEYILFYSNIIKEYHPELEVYVSECFTIEELKKALNKIDREIIIKAVGEKVIKLVNSSDLSQEVKEDVVFLLNTSASIKKEERIIATKEKM